MKIYSAWGIILLSLFGLSHLSINGQDAPPTLAAPIQIQARDFPLYYVSKAGDVPPQLLMRTDFHRYEDKPSYRVFLGDEFKNTPEGAFARYWELLRQPNSDVEKALQLYDAVDLQDAENRDEARRQTESDQENAHKLRDMKLAQRYDVGNYSFLATTFVNQEGRTLTAGTYFLHKTTDGYQLTRKVSQPVNLFYLNGWNLIHLGDDWDKAPRPAYKYSLRLFSPFPKDPPEVHPLTVFFNGTPSHTVLNEQWKPDDKLGQFVKRVVQIYRTGTDEEWLNLWLPESIKYWQRVINPKYSNYPIERKRFKGNENYWIFTIYFGPNIVVFFANEGPRPNYKRDQPILVDHLVIWKGEGTSYKLTDGEKLPSGEETFIGNVDSFLGSEEFQAKLREIVQKAYPAAKFNLPNDTASKTK